MQIRIKLVSTDGQTVFGESYIESDGTPNNPGAVLWGEGPRVFLPVLSSAGPQAYGEVDNVQTAVLIL